MLLLLLLIDNRMEEKITQKENNHTKQGQDDYVYEN